jgi:imidazolonepropionase-like amidohydrolase
MKYRTWLTALLFAGILLPSPVFSQALLIRAEMVFRGDRDRVEKGIDILCIGDRIAAIGPDLETPDGAKIIEAPGMCALPGLIDAHVHLDDGILVSPIYLFLAWGVTTVRDMENAGLRIKGLRELIDSGEILGPRIVYGAESITGDKPHSPFHIQAQDAAAARSAVKRIAEHGADFVLLSANVTPEAAEAAKQEASTMGLTVAVDLLESTRLDALDAARLGMNSLERLGGVPQALRSGKPDQSSHAPPSALFYWLQMDEEKEAQLILELVDREVYLVPTLASFEIMAMPAKEALKNGEATRGLPETGWDSWKEQRNLQDRLPWWSPACLLHFQYAKRFISRAAKAGVKIVAGSGTPTPGLAPGRGLLREIELLAEAGLQPEEALMAATSGAAACLGRQFDIGTLGKGKKADIVLIAGNPLRDLSLLKNIIWVIKGGKPVDRQGIPGFGD